MCRDPESFIGDIREQTTSLAIAPTNQFISPLICKSISMAMCEELRSRIHLLSFFARQWDVFLVGAGMIGGFAVVVLKLLGFF